MSVTMKNTVFWDVTPWRYIENSCWAVNRVEGQLSEEVRVTSGAPQGSALGPLVVLGGS
jgi:hypothetical protein